MYMIGQQNERSLVVMFIPYNSCAENQKLPPLECAQFLCMKIRNECLLKMPNFSPAVSTEVLLGNHCVVNFSQN